MKEFYNYLELILCREEETAEILEQNNSPKKLSNKKLSKNITNDLNDATNSEQIIICNND